MKADEIVRSATTNPPELIGYMDRNRLVKMTDYDDDGPGGTRRLMFEDGKWRGFGGLIALGDRLVKAGQIRYVRLSLSFSSSDVRCPACGVKVTPGSPFWSHYSSKHALRPFWLNQEDWIKLLSEPYQPPPEQQ